MALDDLRKDLTLNLSAARNLRNQPGIVENLGLSKIVEHLVDSLWPFQEAMLDEIDDMDASMAELAESAGDLLQPETAGVFAQLVIQGRALAKELAGRADLAAKLAEFEATCIAAEAALEEITVGEVGDEEDEDEGDDSDEEDGDGDTNH